jgi:hypothetical protein
MVVVIYSAKKFDGFVVVDQPNRTFDFGFVKPQP